MSVEDVVRVVALSTFYQGVGCFCEKTREHEWISEQKKMKLDGWRDKPLQGQYPSRTDEKGVSCWRWCQAGYLKEMTKSLLVVVQGQILVTKFYRVTTFKQQGSQHCKMKGKLCIFLVNVQNWLRPAEYKKCYDNVATMVS